MGLYDYVADLPLVVDSSSRTRHERDTSSGFTRATTVFSLSGDVETGRGEDVTYDAEDHEALAEASSFTPNLAGEYTFAEFSARLDELDLFPTKPPEREDSRHYRRWALESAGLDLALRQAGETLGDAVGRSYDPVRFVVSTRLGDDPSTDRIDALLERDPGMEFKLDPTGDWADELVAALAATGAVRILDLKGLYRGTTVDQEPDAALYERVVEGFPEAILEDPAFTDGTESILDGEEGRISWDVPVTGVDSVEVLPFEPRWLNVKPSRFGTAEALFDTLDYCEANDVSLYGGGQFELGPGRGQIQALASLFYPTGPNDVAPGGYNDPDPPDGLPTSPLSPPADFEGLGR